MGVSASINLNQMPLADGKNTSIFRLFSNTVSYSYDNTGQLNVLLSKISNALPNFSLLTGELPTPVLFIDECQKLNRLQKVQHSACWTTQFVYCQRIFFQFFSLSATKRNAGHTYGLAGFLNQNTKQLSRHISHD